ncbi:glycoside hydrolase superfamily [Phascolomyces articulosus]|uniref:alpha-amylase n=1 Tax=Phascolomyces articulosus TaxID=60185 RepID=A0AAD5PH64_9FUNG|nr:glycoside hydrolase superfamily [Phascolomyces articulosus]
MKFTTITQSILLAAISASALARPLENKTIVKRAGADDWRDRSIYQILTDRFSKGDSSGGDCGSLSDYCGGTFQGVVSQLDYISGMGFDAIWISPIPANSPGGYHGYWGTDFSAINENFGSADDLKALVAAAHERDMYVMLDVVPNHSGPTSNGDYSGYTFDSADDYHTQCSIDYDDQDSIEQCWVADVLPDVNTENDSIVSQLHDILSNWITTYGFDGIRIDTVKHVRKDFWGPYQAAGGVFATGEVFHGDQAYVGSYQEQLDSLLNFPLYYAISETFKSGGSMSRLANQLSANRNSFKDVSVLTNFVDNHDVVRFLNANSDVSQLKNALALVLLAEGIPVVYYGTEQGYSGGADPANREVLWTSGYSTDSDLYKFIATVNGKIRQKSGKTVVMDVDVGDNTYAFLHGNALVVLNNYGSGASNQVTVSVGANIDDNTALTDAISGSQVTVSGGSITFTITDGLPAIFVAGSA